MDEATNPITTASNPRVGPLERVRHLKRGTEYEVLGEAELQIATRKVFEEDRLTVYRSVADGKIWCRLTDEFRDGRFKTIASAPSPGTGGDLVSYLHRQWAWSKETFGPALRTKGIVQHITKELREIEAEPHDLAEWVDVIILAMDGFWRHGGKPEDLLPAMQAKQDKNFARQWPDWRTMGEDQAIEHDRSGEAAEKPWWWDKPWDELNYYGKHDVKCYYQNLDPQRKVIVDDPRPHMAAPCDERAKREDPKGLSPKGASAVTEGQAPR